MNHVFGNLNYLKLKLREFLLLIRSSKQCGCWWNDTQIKFTEKIIGGYESIPHSWPWIVSIRKRMIDKPLGLAICGDLLFL